MDYSASINDAEHPAEASPWGNSPSSSPRHNRTAFGALVGDPPSSPFPSASNNGLHDDGGFGASDTEYRRPDTASTVSQTTDEPPHSEQYQEQPRYSADHGPQSPPPQQQQQHQQQPQQQQPPKPAQQPRKPPPPQFKLQAKITGLERTGRKDPILRFDVHVRHPGPLTLTDPVLTLLSSRQTSPPSAPPSTATCAACTPSSSSWPTT